MFRLRGVATATVRPSLATRPRLTSPGLFAFGRRTVAPVRLTSRVWESTASSPKSGEKEDGHIAVNSNESILFFDNIFPLKLSTILNRPWKTNHDVADLLQRFESSSLGTLDPIRLVKTAIPQDMGMKVTEINPRLKDGGAFVKFEHEASLDPAEIEQTLTDKLKANPLRPWFSPFRGIQARLVRGTPWLEDLYRYPSSYVRVEFVTNEPGTTPQELSEETLYQLFRKYGKIADIIPQPQDSKVTPRYAHLSFPLLRDAIMARNCMHGYIVGETLGGGLNGTRLRMSYDKRPKTNSIWDWLTNHPRIVIPVLAALLAGISVIIFDPIRQFFVKLHIQHSFQLSDYKIYKWFKSQTGNFNLGKQNAHRDDLKTVWKHRSDLISQLQSWLDGSSDTFIVVMGPKGSGKKEMVMDQGLKGRKNILTIDCRPIIEARGEAGTIRKLANAVGYRPVFSWANSLSSLVDLAVQSTTGVKAGFSETLESQLTKILYTTSAALKDVALSRRTKKDKDADLSDDAYLDSHPEKRPILVIDNFLHKADDQAVVYEKIAEWAASIVQNKIAHVVFLTNDSSFTKPLSKALPDRVLRELSLGDLDPKVARNFVLGRLNDHEEEVAENESDEKDGQPPKQRKIDYRGLNTSIETMGGRLTDLEFLTRRIKAGQSPQEALEEIVDENATDIVKIFLRGKNGDDEKKWSVQQAWHLIKSLSQGPSLRYNEVVLSAPFSSSLSPGAKDAEAALEGLANAELISIGYHLGRPQTIKASKPLNQAAFQLILNDTVLRAKMELASLTEMSKFEAKTIETAENELSLLGHLPKQTRETSLRVSYLLKKLESSQQKITDLEREMGELKQILRQEH
ncbi:hypothetical protein V2G26_001122 [Clonostachys chloroleuca]|uniref:Mitochondrial escape protein 2 n=1 Tax=Clonostachys chloroleuca TaxID=1926264 RepID=A0AA35QAN5_9HYPO|nr:unnamed protein product [Clonostachys chloroleuca]